MRDDGAQARFYERVMFRNFPGYPIESVSIFSVARRLDTLTSVTVTLRRGVPWGSRRWWKLLGREMRLVFLAELHRAMGTVRTERRMSLPALRQHFDHLHYA